MISREGEDSLLMSIIAGRVSIKLVGNKEKGKLILDEKVNIGDWKALKLNIENDLVKVHLSSCNDDGRCERCNHSNCRGILNNFR